jgi:deazaflavin-dependent oxidoreductase (nitroreductase family)
VSARYIKPGWFRKTVLDKTFSAFTRLGVSVWGSRLLRVRGRKSGEWRSTPVNVVTCQANRYLVSPRGHTQWVRNIRASKEGELVLGGRAERFRAVEISDEEKLPILREYLRRWKFEVGMFFNGVGPDSPESELRRIAPDHPVFRVNPATDSFS